MGALRSCALVLALTSAAHAEPSVSCVVVRMPTAEQRTASAADVERLLDAYESTTSDNAAWPAALAEVFDRFPLPAVNVLMAQHHPAWSAPEKQLVAYVEAARQDPGDYADRAAVAQTIERIERTLLPEVRRRPLLIVEARGVVRRQDMAKLGIRVDGHACTGDPMSAGEAYTVSWTAAGRGLAATVTPAPSGQGEDRCLAIDGDGIGPCGGMLRRVKPPTATRAALKGPPAPRFSPRPSPPPSLDYRLAIPGLTLAAVGFGLGTYASRQVDVYMNRAEGGADPECFDKRCTETGMRDVTRAQDWKTAFYVGGACGLLGLGALLTSGHRYYAAWLSPSPEHVAPKATSRLPSLAPIAAARGAGLLLQSRFW